MAVALQPKLLTYEDYLAEGETEGRYEIIDGVRHFMTGATRRHNRITDRITLALFAFEASSGLGKCYSSPGDILISRKPLRTRQPDVYFMTNDRIQRNPPEESPDPVTIGPELAVEVLSPSDNRVVLGEKLDDYAKLGVNECWLVSSESGTVQVLELHGGKYRTVEIYGDHDTVQSVVFPSLTIKLDDIFAP